MRTVLTEPQAREPGVFPPVRNELPIYALWLAPVILAGIMNWAWWVPFPLLVPGFVLWRRVCRAAAAARDARMPPALTRADEIPFTIASAVVGFALVVLGTNRYVGAVFVGAWIALLAPVHRAIWRRVDREERELLNELDAEVAAGAVWPLAREQSA